MNSSETLRAYHIAGGSSVVYLLCSITPEEDGAVNVFSCRGAVNSVLSLFLVAP